MTADELKAIAAFVEGLDRLEIAHGVSLDLAGSYDDRFIRLSIEPSVRLRRFPHEVEIHPNGHDLTLVRSDVDVSPAPKPRPAVWTIVEHGTARLLDDKGNALGAVQQKGDGRWAAYFPQGYPWPPTFETSEAAKRYVTRLAAASEPITSETRVAVADEIEADERRARAAAEGIEVARQRGFPQSQLHERREAQPGQDASTGGAGGGGGYQRVSIVFGGGGGGYRGQGGNVSSGTGGSGERHPAGPTPPGAGSGNVPLVLLVPGAGGGIGGEGTGGRGSNGAAMSIVDVPEGAEARGGGVTVSNRPICETEGCEREATTDGPNGTFLCDDCAGEP